jgi:hypothetical protein
MLEDFRNHDPNPTVHEQAWMETNPYPVVFRLVVLALVAVMLGLSAADALSPETPFPVSTAARTAG